jgi:hypothetical protein
MERELIINQYQSLKLLISVHLKCVQKQNITTYCGVTPTGNADGVHCDKMYKKIHDI